MKNQHTKNPRWVLGEIVDRALQQRYFMDTYIEEPGEIIGRLTPEQREVLAKLKSEDIQGVRWPRPDGLNLEKLPHAQKRKVTKASRGG